MCLVVAWYGFGVTLSDYLGTRRTCARFDMPRWMVVGLIPLSFLMMAIEFARFLWRGENFLAPLAEHARRLAMLLAWYWVALILFGSALGLMMLGIPVAIGFFVTNIVAAVLFMGGRRASSRSSTTASAP